eukprot:TRINITY_DN20440_c0_g1_i1.p1 TRINITY_DN20440_c0_g1~~TRINITY_DN20440_c0_g1_i1.p1  ORF type:complete len:361 (+),score=114.33 TRINITY_DN20440_c0_g1_i1:44-1126(+)
MDVQRAKRRGKPNLWVVVPIYSQTIKNNLKELQLTLEDRYKKARSELRKGFADVEGEMHITLFAMHSNKARMEQVKEALKSYSLKLQSDGVSRNFELEIKGLGAWTTKSNCVCLYADLGKESTIKVKELAKELRDYVKNYLIAHSEGSDISTLLNPTTPGETDPQPDLPKPNTTTPSDSASDSDCDIPMNLNKGFPQAKQKEKKKNRNYDLPPSHSDTDPSGEEESEGDVQEEERDDQFHSELYDSEHSEEDLSSATDGFWLDDPKSSIYVPHLTILHTDPKWDKILRTTLNDRRGRGGKKATKNRAAPSDREPFGWNFSLFRDLRSEYSKMVFGREAVLQLELQHQFETLQVIPLMSST